MATLPTDEPTFVFTLSRDHTIELGIYDKAIWQQLNRMNITTLPTGTSRDVRSFILPGRKLQVTLKLGFTLSQEDYDSLWGLLTELVSKLRESP